MAENFDERLFLGFIEGDLSPEDTIAFERKLLEDPRLRNLVAQLILDRHRVRTLADEEPPAELMEQVDALIERKMLLDTPSQPEVIATIGVRKRYRVMRIATYAALAACLLIAVGLFIQPLTDWNLVTRAQEQPRLASSTDQAPPAEAPERELAPPGAALALKGGPDSATDAPAAALKAAPEPVAITAAKSSPTVARPTLALVERIREESGLNDQYARIVEVAPDSLARATTRGVQSKAAANTAFEGLAEGEMATQAPALQNPPTTPDQLELDGLASAQQAVEPPPVSGDLELQVVSNDHVASQRAVADWARFNQVAFVPIKSAAGSGSSSQAQEDVSPAKASKLEAAAQADQPETAERIALVISARQLPALVEHLNAGTGVRAQLVAQKDSDARAMLGAIAHQLEPTEPPTQEAQARQRAAERKDANAAPSFSGALKDQTPTSLASGPAPETLKLNRVSWASILNEQLPVQQSMPIDGDDTQLILPVVFQKPSQ